MQINGTPNIRSISHVGRVRRDTLDIALLESMAKGDQAALRVLGIPPSTVKTRMHYARNRMATLLERAGIDGLRA